METSQQALAKSPSVESLSTQASSNPETNRAVKSPYPPQRDREQPWKKFYPAFRPSAETGGKMIVSVPYGNYDNGTMGLGGF
jgi:hypothetical protein